MSASHRQALLQLLDRSIGSASSDAFKAQLVDEILRVNASFAPSLESGTALKKITHVWHFAGAASIPAELRGPGPHELTMEQLTALVQDHALLIYKTTTEDLTLAFDTRRGRFKSR